MKTYITGKQIINKSAAACLGLVLLSACLLSGCTGGQPSSEENLIIVESEQAEVEYNLAVASVGDVVKTKKIRCDYKQLQSMDMAFATGGKEVRKVYVKAGDDVVKGQLLAELDIGDVDSKVRDLEYRITRNSLLLSYVDENENNEISSMWLKHNYEFDFSEEKQSAQQESIAKLQQKNEYSREDYRDAIAIDTLELEQIRKEIAECYLYAEMDGTVSYVKSNMEGMKSEAGQRVISIIDGTEGLLVADDAEYASYFAEGTEVELSILSGTGAGSYKVIPYKMEEWEDKLWFTFTEDTDKSVIKVGDIGTLKLVTGMREQVLKVPLEAVHTADGKSYVYVVGAGNIREVKWIETGLYGDTEVEVTSGLTEGEKVILK